MWDIKESASVNSLLKTTNHNKQSRVCLHSLCLIDDNTIAAGSNNDINIYTLVQPVVGLVFQKKLVGHTNNVCTLHAVKKILISASFDKTCKLWNVVNGKCLRTFTGHTSCVYGLVVLNERTMITTGTEVIVWELKSGKFLRKIEEGIHGIYCITVSKDHKLYSCGRKSKVKIYNLC